MERKLQYLYRHFDKDGALLYIGISGNPRGRLKNHTAASSWFHRVKKVEIETYEDRDIVKRAEIEAIQREKPLFNCQGARRAKPLGENKVYTESQFRAWGMVGGRKGGLIGGPARAKALSKSRRSEIAKLAAKARWANGKRER